jgi:hypothetical protein
LLLPIAVVAVVASLKVDGDVMSRAGRLTPERASMSHRSFQIADWGHHMNLDRRDRCIQANLAS